MARFESSVSIHADPAAVFALTHDYSRRLTWDTLLREARLLDGALHAGLGVKSLCVGKWRHLGLGVESVYVTFDPPWRAAVRMTRGPWIFANFAASIHHEVVTPGVTRVTYKGHVTTRPSWLRWCVEPLVARLLRRETHRRLESLRRAIEAVPPPTVPPPTR